MARLSSTHIAVASLALLLAAAPALGATKQQTKFATCKDALTQTPGYNFTMLALANCPDLEAMQSDSSVAMTYFVPSDKAIKALAAHIGLPVATIASPRFKGMMCNVLKYHVVSGSFPKKSWTVGQTLTTNYQGAKITVKAVGAAPAVETATGSVANIKRVLFCGNSIAFGVDSVLTPFKVPKLSLPGFGRH